MSFYDFFTPKIFNLFTGGFQFKPRQNLDNYICKLYIQSLLYSHEKTLRYSLYNQIMTIFFRFYVIGVHVQSLKIYNFSYIY